jgi:hypothetical protein
MGIQYHCGNEKRRHAVRKHLSLNGIDYLEVLDRDASDKETRQRTLLVRCLKPVPAELAAINVQIQGGVRVTEINVLWAAQASDSDVLFGNGIISEDERDFFLGQPGPDHLLLVRTEVYGDFSSYRLSLVKSPTDSDPPNNFDPILSRVDFSFKVECPSDFDCEQSKVCPPEPIPSPEINYLAKDYASFRRVMLDRMALLMPDWKEQNTADLGITLVELLAYAGDHLSYYQDAVATEAYIGTARRRISVRRHARLVDYLMHDGCNARAYVQIRVKADVLKTLPDDPPRLSAKKTKLLTHVPDQETLIPPDGALYNQAVSSGSEVFETMAPVDELYLAHNELHFYTWGEQECCLPGGATRATLMGNHPNLTKGDVLILVEKLGPETGKAEDADPARRHAVRLTSVATEDRDGGDLTDPLNDQPITEIKWHIEDALPFPFCISSTTDNEHGGIEVSDVSIALGNIVLADHGRTIHKPECIGAMPRPTIRRIGTHDTDNDQEISWVPPRFRPRLKEAPLTHAAPYPYSKDDDLLKSAKNAMHWDIRDALPVITELEAVPMKSDKPWTPKRDLLNSSRTDPDFVVEIETDGSATLRFGDDNYGLLPDTGTKFTATYRVGNGVRGNVGRGALVHIVTDIADIKEVTNPLPAKGGIEPEKIEQVRQSAPNAFRTQKRAVTTADYEKMACRYPDVQRAAATLRWTGSWHTVFLTVDRLGGAGVDPAFEIEMRNHIESYRMAGHDMEIDNPRLVPLEIEIAVCVQPNYFVSDVKEALLEVFCNRILPDERMGVFHPDNFTFGESVYISRLYAAAEAVEGVASVNITTFQRQGIPSNKPLKKGELTLERLEIACLDNDPNFPDRGVFRLKMEGGK